MYQTTRILGSSIRISAQVVRVDYYNTQVPYHIAECSKLSTRSQTDIMGPLPPVDFICKGRLNMTTCSLLPSYNGPSFNEMQPQRSIPSTVFAARIWTSLQGVMQSATKCKPIFVCVSDNMLHDDSRCLGDDPVSIGKLSPTFRK